MFPPETEVAIIYREAKKLVEGEFDLEKYTSMIDPPANTFG
jgi:hypothetical protein